MQLFSYYLYKSVKPPGLGFNPSLENGPRANFDVLVCTHQHSVVLMFDAPLLATAYIPLVVYTSELKY